MGCCQAVPDLLYGLIAEMESKEYFGEFSPSLWERSSKFRMTVHLLGWGVFWVFLPLLGRGAGVRVGSLGFWGSAPGFCCFCRDLGVMTIFRTGKILKYSASTLPCMLPASATRGAASSV